MERKGVFVSLSTLFFFWNVLLAFNNISIVTGKTCDVNTFASGSFNTECDEKNKPYCVKTDLNPFSLNPSFECVECLNNCDCKENQFCSKAPGEYGTCIKFDRNGKECRALDDGQLSNATFPDNWKCAMFYNDYNGTVRVNQKGVCVQNKCRYCAYDGSNTGIPNCNPQNGLKGSRVCVYPGTQVDRHNAPWYPTIYYQSPRNVWWAIFFCLLIITIVIQCITCCVKRNSPKGEKKSKSFNSSHTSEINLASASPQTSSHSTANNAHTTISPSANSSHNTMNSNNSPPPYQDPNASKHSTMNSNAPPPYEG